MPTELRKAQIDQSGESALDIAQLVGDKTPLPTHKLELLGVFFAWLQGSEIAVAHSAGDKKRVVSIVLSAKGRFINIRVWIGDELVARQKRFLCADAALARWHAAEGHHSYANQWRMTYRLIGNADMQTTIDHYVDFLKVGSVRPL